MNKNLSTSQKVFQFFQFPLMLLSYLMILAGSGLLLWVVYLVVQYINHPENIQLVQFILKQVRGEELLVSGNVGEMKFSMKWSESIRTVLFLFMGIGILSILAGVMHTLIRVGLSILKVVTQYKKSESKN